MESVGKKADYIASIMMVDNFLPNFDMTEKVCPANAVVIENDKANHALVNCQACYACVHACTQKEIGFTIGEKNTNARYRNENVTLEEIIEANK